MPDVNEAIAAVAAAVADGSVVDWAGLGATPMSPADRTLLAELRVLQEVHGLHRASQTPPALDGSDPATAGTSRETDKPRPPQAIADATTIEQTTAEDQWGPLTIREVLGSGGFGVVYRAWDPNLATEVALKVLKREVDTSRGYIDEARLLARVRHPNIVSIYGADRSNGQVGLWMELVRGRTLKQALKEQGKFGAREAALVGLDLTRALAAVHGAGLVHRDVKPHNVMREDGGRIVLMDFGAGTERADQGGRPAKYAGTPLYMAPEMFDHEYPTPATDLYSLGILLYHLVTGSYPVDGANGDEVKAAHARGERRRLRDVRPDLPTEFVRIVERAIDPDPAKRYTSAGELEADLAAFVVPDQRPRHLDGVETPTSWFRKVAWTALAAVAVVAALLAGRSLWIARQGPPATFQSLVVLPLRNASGDSAQDYFVNGMTELLTADLSGISSLRVISNASASTYRSTQKSNTDIGRELHVDGIIEGSVARSGDRVRVTLQVVHAGSNLSVWGDSYEREAKDAFRLQAEIARTLATKLKAVLTPGERHRLEQTYAASPEAQDLYLRAVSLLHTLNRDALVEARALLEKAVQVDANYGLAWASLARCYVLLQTVGVLTPAEARTLATRAAETSLAHDPAMFEAHTAIAEVRFKFDWDWQAADEHYRAAIQANPNFSLGRSQYARFLSAAGRMDDALAQAVRAEESDPVSTEMKNTVAVMLFYQRRYRDAAQKASEGLAVDNRLPVLHVARGRALAGLGDFNGAIQEMQEALSRSDNPAVLAELGRIYAVSGRRADAEAVIARLKARAQSNQGFIAAQDLGYVYAALGRLDEALSALEQGVDQRSERILWLRVDPRVDMLRDSPRFKALLQRIGGLDRG